MTFIIYLIYHYHYIFTALPVLYIISISTGMNNSSIGLLVFFEIHQWTAVQYDFAQQKRTLANKLPFQVFGHQPLLDVGVTTFLGIEYLGVSVLSDGVLNCVGVYYFLSVALLLLLLLSTF